MPDISEISGRVTLFPSLYVSPFGNDGTIPLYSSIPIRTQLDAECLPCVVCGNSNTRFEIIEQEAFKVKTPIKNEITVSFGT
jgi:hypothetical protein